MSRNAKQVGNFPLRHLLFLPFLVATQGIASAQTFSGPPGQSGSSSSSGPLSSMMSTLTGGGSSANSTGPQPTTTAQSTTTSSQTTSTYGFNQAGAAIGSNGSNGVPGQPGSGTTVNAATQATSQLAPFGASLFTNTTPIANLAPNPNYIIQPGDTVSIEVYGGVSAQVSSQVDTQGNVFLPNFGPVHVAGVNASSLQASVSQQIAHGYTNKVNVYAVLETESSIGVFVTGFVKSPGQYLGSASDSLLNFLSMAGGVDPSRGSYRDILLMRGGRVIEQIDLYDFLLDGTRVPDTLQNGDTIVVSKQEPMVAVGGSVRNNYLFEIPYNGANGQSIVQLAQPLPDATNVLITGTRGAQPYSQYVSLGALNQTPLYDQDQVTFIADIPAPTITVQVQGSRIGPSVLVAGRDATLKTLLSYIAVDPSDADVKAIYIIRPGLAQQQMQSIQAALDRLQKALFYATSVTTGEAQIRASEATQIQSYINNARTIQPDGILVVANDDGSIQDVRLEEGDTIFIPESSDTVMVDGEVEAPQAEQFNPAFKKADYVKQAGGYTERGRPPLTIIRRLSGRIVLDPNAAIMPGDELLTLPYVETENFVIATDVLSLLYQVAASTYFASKL